MFTEEKIKMKRFVVICLLLGPHSLHSAEGKVEKREVMTFGRAKGHQYIILQPVVKAPAVALMMIFFLCFRGKALLFPPLTISLLPFLIFLLSPSCYSLDNFTETLIGRSTETTSVQIAWKPEVLNINNKIARKWTAFESLKKTLTDGGMMSSRPGCPGSAVVVSVVALQWRSWSRLWIKILPRDTEDVAAAVADDNGDEVEDDFLIQSYWLMTNVNLWPLFWQHWFQKKKKKKPK